MLAPVDGRMLTVVPCGSQAHGDGEDGSCAVTSDAVQGFAPPVEGRDAESLDSGELCSMSRVFSSSD